METNGGGYAAPKSSRARQVMAPLAKASRYDTIDEPRQHHQHQQQHHQQQQHRQQPHQWQLQVRTPKRPGVYAAGTSKRRETPTQAHQRAVYELTRQLTRDASGVSGDELDPSTAKKTKKEMKKKKEKEDENAERGNWSGRLDFLLSCIGYAVGLGNVWRFPYMCYSNGGGAFLVPYILFLLLCGIPVFLLDLSLGQFTSEGPATCWEFAPIFNGVGYAMAFLSTCVGVYYNMIIAYSLYYFFASMHSVVPWSGCFNSWNTQFCRDRLPLIATCNRAFQQANGTCYNGTKLLGLFNETLLTKVTGKSRILPADEYYNNEVLKISSGIDSMGPPDWKLTLCLLASWIVVFLCMIRGIKSSGKVVYFTALFPYVVLLILFFRGVTLSNAGEGIRFYMVPDFARLADATVWKDAAGQIFFSLSASWGGLMSLASYNKFHNNVIRDTFIVCIANCATSVFAGFVIFSFIGHLAGSLGVPVQDVSKSGFGLAFVIYPEAVNLLPGTPFWALLFFFMLLLLGLDSQFAMVETLVTSLCDKFRFFRLHKTLLIGVLSVIMFLLGLPFACKGGPYLMQVIDSYSGSWTILLIGFFECISVGWVYGRPGLGKFHRFSEDIGIIMKRPIWCGWRYLWQFISPILILFIIIFNWAKYERSRYGNGQPFPAWADAIGWLLAGTSVAIIVGTGLFKLAREPREDSLLQRLTNLSIPSFRWGPSLPKHRMLMANYLRLLGALEHFYLDPRRRIKYTEVFGIVEAESRHAFTMAAASSSVATATEESNRQPATTLSGPYDFDGGENGGHSFA